MINCFPYNPPDFIIEQISDPSQLREVEESVNSSIQDQRNSLLEKRKEREKEGKRFDKIKYRNNLLIDIPEHYKHIPEKVHADVVEALIGACFT